jgi:arsenite methyltransferase
MAVCERNYKLLTSETYNNDFIGIAPADEREGKPWNCATGRLRAIADTKGGQYQDKSNTGGCC